jgi:hypothetical protein
MPHFAEAPFSNPYRSAFRGVNGGIRAGQAPVDQPCTGGCGTKESRIMGATASRCHGYGFHAGINCCHCLQRRSLAGSGECDAAAAIDP